MNYHTGTYNKTAWEVSTGAHSDRECIMCGKQRKRPALTINIWMCSWDNPASEKSLTRDAVHKKCLTPENVHTMVESLVEY